ncbi:hypothetical protein JV33_01275 [Pectobacterium carotovorum subsp. carotovorum]|nr:hypothetical protein JV33_01275 [Pectobacterium carotovorum subsp. carotovorum]KML66696.1 hypothetical protein G032_16625 [Pectobacterium carotovorum subsp. carotovorum ICMP 5702]
MRRKALHNVILIMFPIGNKPAFFKETLVTKVFLLKRLVQAHRALHTLKIGDIKRFLAIMTATLFQV